MAANFQQHMGGSAPMMSQPKPQQQRAPQASPQAAQIQQFIYNALNSQSAIMAGWQISVQINERIALIFNMYVDNYLFHSVFSARCSSVTLTSY